MGVIVIIFITLKSVIYGLSIFFTGNLIEQVDVLDVLALRFLMSFVALWLLKITRVLRITVGVKDIVRRTEHTPYIKPLLLAGLFEPVLYMVLETVGVSMTTDITAGVILSLSPIFSCINESLFLKEKSSFLQKVFLGIGIVGVMYIALNTDTSDGQNTVVGILCMFLAVISGTLFCVFSRKSSRHFSTFDITYITCMMGAAIFNVINVVRHIVDGDILQYFAPLADVQNLIGFVYLSILSTIAATAMGNFALSRAKVSSLAAFGGVSTLVTIAAGVLLRNETLYAYQIIGIILIVIRMVGVSYIDMRKKG